MRAEAFSPRKSAQVAAYYAIKGGGRINGLKVMKLMYLAEREFIARHDMPMLFDKLVSMEHGPALACTLNYINGEEDSPEWNGFVADRENHDLGLSVASISLDDLDELSCAEFEVLSAIWDKFGFYDKSDLRIYTHNNCPEWENPGESSRPIPYPRLLRYLGKDNADRVAEEIEAMHAMAKSFVDAEYIYSSSEISGLNTIWAAE